ncbi:MAG: hypothetical protein FJW76_00130 [Actinobacteria bacterium]|nr:hypothetical protein [Actinomycetota bacterium]
MIPYFDTVGSGLLYLSIVVLWGAVLVPMWLKHLTRDELGSVNKFNKSMTLLGSVPQIEVPTYRARTAAQVAAARRRRTVLILSAITVLGSAISIVTGLWFLMALPAILLFGFFVAAWRAVSRQVEVDSSSSANSSNISRAEQADKAKEWEATPTVLPNRVVGEKGSSSVGQSMVDLAAKQSEQQNVSVEEQTEIGNEIYFDDDQPNQQSAVG